MNDILLCYIIVHWLYYYITLYYIILCYITLFCIILYYIVLHSVCYFILFSIYLFTDLFSYILLTIVLRWWCTYFIIAQYASWMALRFCVILFASSEHDLSVHLWLQILTYSGILRSIHDKHISIPTNLNWVNRAASHCHTSFCCDVTSNKPILNWLNAAGDEKQELRVTMRKTRKREPWWLRWYESRNVSLWRNRLWSNTCQEVFTVPHRDYWKLTFVKHNAGGSAWSWKLARRWFPGTDQIILRHRGRGVRWSSHVFAVHSFSIWHAIVLIPTVDDPCCSLLSDGLYHLSRFIKIYH